MKYYKKLDLKKKISLRIIICIIGTDNTVYHIYIYLKHICLNCI